MRSVLAGWALRRARHTDGAATDRWLARSARWSPGYSHAHAELQRRLLAKGNHATALREAQDANRRFPGNGDAWVLLGEAYRAMYRTKDALVAFEQALVLEERADAAMAAGAAYRQLGDPVNAGARFARAYAAGAGPDALKANAEMLRRAGDTAAAEAAEARWREEAP